jgi:hypothetical protein
MYLKYRSGGSIVIDATGLQPGEGGNHSDPVAPSMRCLEEEMMNKFTKLTDSELRSKLSSINEELTRRRESRLDKLKKIRTERGEKYIQLIDDLLDCLAPDHCDRCICEDIDDDRCICEDIDDENLALRPIASHEPCVRCFLLNVRDTRYWDIDYELMLSVNHSALE